MSVTSHRLILPPVYRQLVSDSRDLQQLLKQVESKLCKARTKSGQPWRKLTEVELIAGKVHVFLSSIREDGSSGCWEWTAGRNLPPSLPYGRFKFHWRECKAHNFSYALFEGPIPDGLLVCHKCDNPKCVRPDHLFLGTPLDNVRDCHSKGRQSKEYSQLLNRFGDKNGNAKLSELDAISILSKLKSGIKPMKLAATYGVTVGSIYHLRSGFTWQNLASHRV
jgi:hypothetical protein